MAAAPGRISFQLKGNVAFNGLRAAENVVFFGKNLGSECERCGAYEQTSLGHKFCSHIACPIALIEFKRRKRKRTSSLEKVYVPLLAARSTDAQPPAEPPK